MTGENESRLQSPTKVPRLSLAALAPGLLLAATGVGAGDLATGAMAGSKLGTTVLWAVVVAAVLKYFVNEGLARWQLATGSTMLEGLAQRVGKITIWLFMPYLLFWSFFVAVALMGACGAAMNAMLPWPGDDPQKSAQIGRVVYGVLHSLVAVALIRVGGFVWFERVMSLLVGLMFCIVIGTALAIGPEWSEVLRGLVWPTIPHADGEGLSWTLALVGGIGGTVTILCYSYWMREDGREGKAWLSTCRADLASGYGVTAAFGIAMVIIGSEFLTLEGDVSKGTRFLAGLGKEIESRLGPLGWYCRWGFLLGAWSAVFTSMLGVWQSVPKIFGECYGLLRPESRDSAWGEWIYGLLLASVPAVGLFVDFTSMQKTYSVVGAMFVPLAAAVLLYMNRRADWVGTLRSSLVTQVILALALLAFFVAGVYEAIS